MPPPPSSSSYHQRKYHSFRLSLMLDFLSKYGIHFNKRGGEGIWTFADGFQQEWYDEKFQLTHVTYVEPNNSERFFCDEYFKDNQRHRADGPAVVYSDRREWWKDGDVENRVC